METTKRSDGATPLGPDYLQIASLEVDAVRLQPAGFVMQGFGEDSAEYVLELHLDLPMDRQTQAIVGEMLSQSEMRLWRRTQEPLRSRLKNRVPS